MRASVSAFVSLLSLLVGAGCAASPTRAAPAAAVVVAVPHAAAGHPHEGPSHDAHGPAGHAHDASGHGAHEHGRAPLGGRLIGGWCDPWDHFHESPCGTPYVHGFLTEPAFLGREAFLDVADAGEGAELELEVEWAITRRVGLLLEVPWALEGEEEGPGDVGFGVRALLAEGARVHLAAGLALEAPTAEGADDGEWVVVPSVSGWADLGRWVTMQAQVSLEVPTETEGASLAGSVALSKSFRVRPLLPGPCAPCAQPRGHGHDGGGVLSLIAEARGAVVLDGDAEGETESTLLLGASVPISASLELRGAWTLTVPDGEDATSGWIVGLVFHF